MSLSQILEEQVKSSKRSLLNLWRIRDMNDFNYDYTGIMTIEIPDIDSNLRKEFYDKLQHSSDIVDLNRLDKPNTTFKVQCYADNKSEAITNIVNKVKDSMKDKDIKKVYLCIHLSYMPYQEEQNKEDININKMLPLNEVSLEIEGDSIKEI